MLRPMAAPTRAKRRLGAFLLDLRTTAGMTTVGVALHLKTSDSTVSRYESGHVLPVWSTVLNLINLYSGSADDIARATRLWEDAKDEAPPVRMPASTPKSFRRLVNAEREATIIQAFGPIVWPALLQLSTYATALIEAGRSFHGHADRGANDAVSVRMTRQRLLERADLEYHVIVDEAVICRVVGGPEVARQQIEHVMNLMERPNVTVGVVPFGTGAYGLSSGPYVIVDHPGATADEPGSVYLEYPAGGAWVENGEDVTRFTTMFEEVSAALDASTTVDLLHSQLRALEDR
jgi:transcriptional regulator with XRE-family HTH domain